MVNSTKTPEMIAAKTADPLIPASASGGPIPSVKPKIPAATTATPSKDPVKIAKASQKGVRRQLTMTADKVYDFLARAKPSRRGLEVLMDELARLMDEAIPLHEFLIKVTGIEPKKLAEQQTTHLSYKLLLADVEEHVQEYLDARADDPASTITRISVRTTQPTKPASKAASIHGSQRTTPEVESSADSENERALAAIMERARIYVGEDLGLLPQQPITTRVEAWRRAQPLHTPFIDEGTYTPVLEVTSESAPDDWITTYCNGTDPPFIRTTTRDNSSLHVRMEPFSGQSLEWFSWIDQFRSLVHLTGKEPGEKLALLQSFITHEARLCIAGLGGSEAAYKQALLRLKQTYGRRGVMRVAIRLALTELKLSQGDPTSFQRYADQARTYLFDLSRIGESNSMDIMDGICNRLKLEDRLAWNTERRLSKKQLGLNDFGAWLSDRASAYQTDESIAAAQRSAALNRQAGTRNSHSSFQQREKYSRTHTSASSHTTGPWIKKPPFCFKCEADHRLYDCPLFKTMSLNDRQAFIVDHRLCNCCFGARHVARVCKFKKECGTDGCKEYHHHLIHGSAASSTAHDHSSTSLISHGNPKVALGTVEVDVVAVNGSTAHANMLIDECSDTTFIRSGFANRFGICGDSHLLSINGAGGAKQQHQSRRAKLQLRTDSGELVTITGSTLEVVAADMPTIQWSSLKKNWSHLRDLPLKNGGGRVDILLGADNMHLLAVLESRDGGVNQPVASKTRIGWVVRGVVGTEQPVVSVRTHTTFSSMNPFSELEREMRRFCDTESFGTEHQVAGISQENQRAKDMAIEKIVRVGTKFQAPVIWLPGEPVVENNRVMAESRHRGLINRFKKDPEYERQCREAMEKNFSEGYAVRLTTAEANKDGPVYYLPVFGVPKKWSENKIRLVFDAAARFKGRCLNDSIASGPTLQNSLPLVINRFREGAVGWIADIQAMFSRIQLLPEDRPYHHFFWPERDGSTTIGEMRSVTFGLKCSPFVAIFTTWKAADDAGPSKADVATAVKSNFYIDDYLGSAHSETAAIQIARDVKEVLAEANFNLVGWTSNLPSFTASLTPSWQPKANAETDSLPIGADDSEMVLGMTWKHRRDVLGFRAVGKNEVTYTRLGLASKVATIFDPLGLVAPVTVKGKIRLRSLDTKGHPWSDPLPEEDQRWWEQWVQSLHQLDEFEVPRCIFPNADQIVRTELHTFGDASEEAYCAVSYIRSVYQNGSIVVRIVKASTNLASKKTLSVPKLELNAALLSVRQSQFIEKGITRPLDARWFWTDSSTVRNWIRATASNYQTFVSNRVGEIQTLSRPEEWRFVPGKLNPADGATRSQLDDRAIPLRWIPGAQFLEGSEDSWPIDLPWAIIKTDIRPAKVHHSIISEPSFDWSAVQLDSGHIPTLITLNAEMLPLIKRCQDEVFNEDIQRLNSGKSLRSSSRLLSLNPVLGADGLLRLGGRIEKLALPYDNRHPPIIPGRHPLSYKIIRAFHIFLKHVGTDFLLAHIRQHFWLVNGREAVKKMKRECVECRQFRAKPATQRMADLHQSRLADGMAPFSYSAVDYFGPLDVMYARNRVKKVWGALFTCLTTRAVYLDMAPSLSSDDFLLLLRRFISIYGRPVRIHSDNGTNFVGGERMLREAVLELHGSEYLSSYYQKENIDWCFQPARTPHFGGAHESLVRSTKRALYAALKQEKDVLRHPTEATMQTLLFEIAGLLNSRPLTYASSDPDDFRPLTPNDFMNRPPTAHVQAGHFEDANPRQQFRYSQRAISIFWGIWRSNYLQSLSGRSKWQKPERNMAINDVVMEVDHGLGRGQWSIGHVDKVYPGDDNLVRAVDVKLPNGIFRRGIQRLCLLEPNDSASSVLRPSSPSGENVTAEAP